MPKSAKKRKDKAADFSKAKLKLGKGKQLASNAIDTSFKARSIALPSQSIVRDKQCNAPTTKRRLTLDDLLIHTKHYNAVTRKDAILGLRELLEANWELVRSSLTTLVVACVRLIGDEESSVRKTLLTFFTWLLPRIPQRDLIPHSSLLLLFTTSAQTHIFPEIRIDAIRFLDLFLECIPQTVVDGWNADGSGHGLRVLEGYLGILNAGTTFGGADGPMKATSIASVVLTPGSKLVVLHSLATFFRVSLSPFSGRTTTGLPDLPAPNTWYLLPSFTRQRDYHSFERLVKPSVPSSLYCRRWQEEVDLEDGDDEFPYNPSAGVQVPGDQFSLQELTDASVLFEASESGGIGDLKINFVLHLARTLQPTFIATFLDCAPAAFSPSTTPSEVHVQLILAITQIVRALYGVIIQAPVPLSNDNCPTNELENILGYMSPYFPFNLSGSRDIKMEQAFLDLNLMFCELTSLLALRTDTESTQWNRRRRLRQIHKYTSRRNANGSKDTLSIQRQCVSEYVVRLLHGEPASGSQLGHGLTPTAYVALQPAIWALINNTSTQHEEIANAVLRATIAHSVKTSSKSALKRQTIEFVGRLVLLSTEPQYDGSFRLGAKAEMDSRMADWVTHLPQPLWEFGANNLPASEVILRFLLRILQRKLKEICTSKTISILRSRLIPYFSIVHRHRGQILGPYSKLPEKSHLRRLALDVAFTLMSMGLYSDDGLHAAIDLAVEGTKDRDYWVEILKSGNTK